MSKNLRKPEFQSVKNQVIVIDTREQRPLAFSIPAERGTLSTGDYSLRGYENRVSIERKEMNDLVQCLKSGNRERFERELARGRDLEFFALVVECNLSDLAAHEYRSAMAPRSVIQSVLAFSVRYRLPLFFCGNREYAGRVVESLLLKFIRELSKETPLYREANLRNKPLGKRSVQNDSMQRKEQAFR